MAPLSRTLFVILAAALTASPLAGAGLRATTESQLIQNRRADADHLSRMENRAMAARWVRLELLVPVPSKTRSYYLNAIPASGRYLRPWAKLFLDRLSRQHRARFGKPLRITSLLRTVDHQRRLQRSNGNAAAASGPKRSSHLTGASLDISKKGMSRARQQWLRGVLASLKDKGVLYAVEENQQPNFHVMLYRSYEQYVERLLAKR